jgi:hypothetical protein
MAEGGGFLEAIEAYIHYDIDSGWTISLVYHHTLSFGLFLKYCTRMLL